jgi:GNAT superfamily N-acetyltransferase
MIIRKAKISDLEQITKLWIIFTKEHDKLIIDTDPRIKEYTKKKKDAHINFKNYIKKCIYSKNANVFVAQINQDLVGYSLNTINKNIPIFTIEKLGYVSDLFIKKEYRGKKVSSKFINLAKDWFKSKNIEHMSIKVWPQNKKAYSIYKNWKFIDQHLEMRRKI